MVCSLSRKQLWLFAQIVHLQDFLNQFTEIAEHVMRNFSDAYMYIKFN